MPRDTTLIPPSAAQLKWLERRERLVFLAFLAPALLFLVLMFLVPLGMFLSQSLFDPHFTLENYQKAFTRPVYMKILWRTLVVSGETTLICLLIGYPVAFVMAHGSDRVKMMVTALVLIPFWTNILVRMFAWMALLGRNGVINRGLMETGLTDAPIPMLFNQFSVTIGMVHFMLPYMILPLYSVMTNIPQSLMDAAANLGANTRRTFLRVYLPLSLPGIGAGVLLVFILSLGFFVTPALLGGPQNTMLAQIIELEINDSVDWGFGAALSTILLVLTVALYALYDRFLSAEKIYEGR
ncbi:ABC transporter permease [Leisingera sp. ANG-M1]|uniref:ABC transporter permease n=1 Tax=Leisingera sp. ANG-M1 TaxID=1577895 RepID=UPI00068D98EC|nr:ABC transporter permease [Leisingera sp. ANG-M1]